jgi:DNA anti-recombination protein RmuC
MKKTVYKAVILTVSVIIILFAGCEAGNTSQSEIKRGRLIASENRQLKKQIEKLEKELEKQKELLAKTLNEKKASEEQLQKSNEEQMKKLKTATDENIILRQTNYNLNTQIKQLEEELGKLKDSEKFKKWQEETQKSIDEMAEGAFKDMEEIGKLQEENEKLKAEITELKKELETHEEEPTSSPSTN